jgi:asparagine synthase (glutamine-hydrolysing)
MTALARRGTLPEPETYWSLTETVAAAQEDQFIGGADEAILELEARLSAAVRYQMRADVPLGAFLSGGIDSSTVVALMQAQSCRPVKTFTIGFTERGYNEAEHAKAVARHLGTDHTELYIKPHDAIEVIPRLPTMYDEPFGDSSAIPTFLVSQLARRHVTVSLSGDGGDELFCGYARYPSAGKHWEMVQRIPGMARRAIACAIPFLPGSKRHAYPEALRCGDVLEFYKVMTSQWQTPMKLVKNTLEPQSIQLNGNRTCPAGSVYERMMYADALTYLPDDILVKIDRAAMALSLETRLPLLDHRVVEFAWALPIAMKIRDGQGKWILRQVLNKYVPRVLTERPKMGFGVPVDHWLRGPLRPWAEELLAVDRLQREGYFHPEPIRRRWHQHMSARSNWRDSLWLVLMFQAWLDNQRIDAPINNET